MVRRILIKDYHLLQICLFLPIIGLMAVFDEGEAAKFLAWTTFRGVKVEDAKLASVAVGRKVFRRRSFAL